MVTVENQKSKLDGIKSVIISSGARKFLVIEVKTGNESKLILRTSSWNDTYLQVALSLAFCEPELHALDKDATTLSIKHKGELVTRWKTIAFRGENDFDYTQLSGTDQQQIAKLLSEGLKGVPEFKGNEILYGFEVGKEQKLGIVQE